MAIRRLVEVSSRDPDKEVCSLRQLIGEIEENIDLYIRENYVCYDGVSYEKEEGEYWKISYQRDHRQTRYDILSGKDNNNRSRDDKLSSDVFAKIKKEIERDFGITKEVRIYVNKWVAHASATWNRERHIPILDKISLRKLDDCYKALIRIGKKIELLIDELLLCSIPTPVFDQLKNWDKPVVVSKDIVKLSKYWRERDKEVTDWSNEAEWKGTIFFQ